MGTPRPDIEGVYREHGSRLQRALLLYTADEEITNDAVSEAFAQALRRGAALRSPERWVWRVAFRIAAGELKERRRNEPLRYESAYVMSTDVGELMDALRGLSPNQRASVILHHLAGYQAREVASIIGSTSAAVMVHLSQGRKRLRTLLEDSDG